MPVRPKRRLFMGRSLQLLAGASASAPLPAGEIRESEPLAASRNSREMFDLPGYIGVESMWGMFQLSTMTVIRRNFGGASPSDTHSASYVPKL